MATHYHDERGSDGRWIDAALTSLMDLEGMQAERSPAAAEYRSRPGPPRAKKMSDADRYAPIKLQDPPKTNYYNNPNTRFFSAKVYDALKAMDALEAIPADVENEPAEVAANYAPENWFTRPVLKIVIKDLEMPEGVRVNWAKVAATGLLPITLLAAQHLHSSSGHASDKIALKTGVAPAAIVQPLPKATLRALPQLKIEAPQPSVAVEAQPETIVEAPREIAVTKPPVTDIPLEAKEPLPSRQLIHTAPERISSIFARINKNTPTLRDVMVEVLGSESGFDPKAKSKTGARGLGQFTAPTLIERVYLDRHLFPEAAKATADLVYRYNDAKPGQKPRYKYDVLGDSKKEHKENRKKVLALAYDVETAAIMAQRYIVFNTLHAEAIFRTAVQKKIDTIEKKNLGKPFNEATAARLTALREALVRDLTVADIKQVYTNGVGGGSKTMIANADPVSAKQASKDHAAPAALRYNREFYKAGRQDRTVAETVAHAEELVGNWTVPMEELLLAAK